jgi:hypothetical protein
MKNVYQVRYEVLARNLDQKRGTWALNNEPIHVLANGTAKAAISKAERYLLKQRNSYTDDAGRRRTEVHDKVRITSCERVLSIDA